MSKIKAIFLIITFVSFSPLAFAAGHGTPDGVTPATEEVCSGLQGAAFGLCNAYCEAQDCDVHYRRSCEHLRANFQKKTGSPIFPCDQSPCGNGVPTQGGLCGGSCPTGQLCETDEGGNCCCHDL